MKISKIEKKIYEHLGVNLFRKYVLGLWEKTVLKLLRLEDGYHLPSCDIKGLKNYKITTISYAIAHVLALIISLIIVGDITNIFSWILNGYCIMVQRYNYIRIDELIKKKEKIADKKAIKEVQENLNEITGQKKMPYEETLNLPNHLFDFKTMQAKYYLSFAEILYWVKELIKLGKSKEYIILFVEAQEAYNRSFKIDPEERYQELYNLVSCYRTQDLDNLKKDKSIDYNMLLALNIINEGFGKTSWQIEEKVTQKLSRAK